MVDSVRTGEAFPTYRQTGLIYYLKRTLGLAKRPWAEPGTLAHYTHRFTGLILTFYILAHILVISRAAFDQQGFDDLMATFHKPLFLMLDWLLWGAASFHAFNGFRVMLFDWGKLLDKQNTLVWVVIAATLASMALGLALIFPEVF